MFHHEIKRRTLDGLLAAGINHQQNLAVTPRFVLSPTNHLTCERRGRHVVTDETYQRRRPLRQPFGEGIGMVTKLLCNLTDFLSRRFGNTNIALIINSP